MSNACKLPACNRWMSPMLVLGGRHRPTGYAASDSGAWLHAVAHACAEHGPRPCPRGKECYRIMHSTVLMDNRRFRLKLRCLMGTSATDANDASRCARYHSVGKQLPRSDAQGLVSSLKTAQPGQNVMSRSFVSPHTWRAAGSIGVNWLICPPSARSPAHAHATLSAYQQSRQQC